MVISNFQSPARRPLIGLCALVTLAAAIAAPAWADFYEDRQTVIDTVEESLARGGSRAWYRPETDEVRPLKLLPSSNSTTTPSSNTSSPSRAPAPDMGWAGSVPYWLAWIALVVVVLLALAVIIRSYLNAESAKAQSGRGDGDAGGAPIRPDRVDALPIRISRPQDQWLAAIQSLAEEGRYSEAMLYLYSQLLLELDRAQAIHLARGKTNRQYLREARRASPLGDPFQKTIVAFEDVYFGKYALDRARFEQAWQLLLAAQRFAAQQGALAEA